MNGNSNHKDFLSIRDFSPSDIQYLLTLGRQIKAHPAAYSGTLRRQTLAMIFEKPSLRNPGNFRCRHPATGWLLPLPLTRRDQSGQTRVGVRRRQEPGNAWCRAS